MIRLLAALLALCGLLGAGAPASAAGLCGREFLRGSQHPLVRPGAKLLGPQREAADITVGTSLYFVVAGRILLLPATCRLVGEHCYVFVEDTEWDTNGGPVYQQHVDTLGELFDRATPADPDRGMYELAVATFGEPPDVDGDERIFIVLLDIDDDRVVGFFDPAVAAHAVPEYRRDAVHLDAGAVRLRPHLARGTLAHELQHLIHWGHDADEEAWVDEGLSGYAEQLAGFAEADPAAVPSFLQQPDINLTEWHNAAYSYGSTYLFMSFLAEKYGGGLIRDLVDEPANGAAGIDRALGTSDLTQDFAGVWSEWIAGNFAADDPLHGYAALMGRRALSFLAPYMPFEGVEALVSHQWGTVNVLLRNRGSIDLGFSGDEEAGFHVWLYAKRAGQGELLNLELGPGNHGQMVVEDVDTLAVIVGRTSAVGGGFELRAREHVPTAVAVAEASERPGAAEIVLLGPPFPNPFNHGAVIPFELPVAAKAVLSLHNGLGQRIRVLRRGWHGAGVYEVVWDGRNRDGTPAGSGAYLAVLQVGSRTWVQRLTLVK